MKIKKEHLFLFLLLSISFLLRFPSLFEPNWYGDEGIYQIIGRVLHQGGLLYRDAWDNKPPLLYLLYMLVNGEQFWARLLSLFFLLFSIPAFYFLAGRLFKKTRAIFLSTALFALLFSLPFLEGNIANAENFILLPIIGAALLVINYTLDAKRSTLFLSGFLLSLAFLTKIVAVFDLTAFVLFLFFLNPWKKKKYIWPLFLGFILPIILVTVFFFSREILADFLTATFSQNVGYVEFGNRLFVPQGFLILKLLLLTGFIAVLFWQRSRFTKTQIFIMPWLVLSLFNAFFAGRPWIHYLLVLLPSFSLLVGSLFEEKSGRLIKVAALIFVLVLVPSNFWIYGKTHLYYQNFLSFILGRQSASSYQNFFAPHVSRDYEIAQFLKGRLGNEERVFIWGDNPQIYVLAERLPVGRFTVAYHLTFYPTALSETKEAITRQKPKYIVVLKEILPFEELLRSYNLRFVIGETLIYERSAFLP